MHNNFKLIRVLYKSMNHLLSLIASPRLLWPCGLPLEYNILNPIPQALALAFVAYIDMKSSTFQSAIVRLPRKPPPTPRPPHCPDHDGPPLPTTAVAQVAYVEAKG